MYRITTTIIGQSQSSVELNKRFTTATDGKIHDPSYPAERCMGRGWPGQLREGQLVRSVNVCHCVVVVYLYNQWHCEILSNRRRKQGYYRRVSGRGYYRCYRGVCLCACVSSYSIFLLNVWLPVLIFRVLFSPLFPCLKFILSIMYFRLFLLSIL